VAVASVVVTLVVGAPAAYAFARYRGRVGPILLVLALVFRALPRFAVVLPFYQASRAVGLYDTRTVLVIAFVAINMPFTLLLLTGFFRAIPEELDEAAMVDGCTRLTAFWRVIVPLTGPGLVTAGLFSFLLAFQEYLIPLTLTQNNAVTIPLFVAAQSGADDVTTYQLLAACSLALAVPIVLITIFARKYFVEGLVGGAVKE
jgi:multiple sugar transport system permease protein